MPLDVIMPALGMAQETGLIVAWHKQPGDAVAKGDILFEVETDKATMEVESAGDGFLTDVTAGEGTDVPVGDVIARISETAESTDQTETAKAGTSPALVDELPAGKEVIMPTLGMAQDSGLLVAWHKQPGDQVNADDILFEVETDKSVNEVSAGFDGFLAAILAEAGEDVPTGQTIAIISADAPDNPISRKASAAAPAKKAKQEGPALVAAPEASAKKAPPPPATAASGQLALDGPILASPKARRLAREQGLDLSRLAKAGYAQPYHVRDLETLKALPADYATSAGTAQAASRLMAQIDSEGFTAFADWAAKEVDLKDPSALLAGFCAASLARNASVAVDSFGQSTTYAASAQLGTTAPTDSAPELRLRDLRFTPITSVQIGGEDIPTLTLTRQGAGLSITLEFAPDQLGATEAITLLSNFAGRMEQPLRHLL